MSDRQNVVLVTWDSVRWDHVPTYGYERETTPTLSAMADDGLVFDDVQVPAVGTPASFTGMFSGEHATGSMERPHPKHWREANRGRRFLQTALREAGYHTGGFHFNALMSEAFGWGDGWDVYEDHMWTESDGDDASSGLKGNVYDLLQRVGIANFAVDLKRTAAGEPPARWEAMWDDVAAFVADAPEPFFLWVLLIDTHHPYYAPAAYHEWPQPGLRTMYALNYAMRRHRRLVGKRRESIVNAYDNTIRYADAFVGRLRETLSDAGYGDAPLIVHSDHGDEFGEHANYGHRPLMYDTVTRVPLVMENVGETGRVEGPTSLLDLGSTVLDLAGVDERLGGRPSLLGAERADREFVTIRNAMEDDDRMAAAVGPEWKVLYHPAGDWGAMRFPEESWEAYDRSVDPMERDDRWGDHPAALGDELRAVLDADTTALGEDESEGDAGMNASTEERLRQLGYIE